MIVWSMNSVICESTPGCLGDNLSDWVCNAKGCDKKVPGYMHSLVMDSRKKSGNNQKSCPDHLLCKDCHDVHTGGTGSPSSIPTQLTSQLRRSFTRVPP
eukprot:COSAG02_NODE_4124_length_5744_cov_7.379451_4_plen_99_part_00